ncbi:MAG: hypothetical protein JNL43_04345 [Flavobacteriales bacterium]|nr:hypothetical protein [Flavobacteriales bacterium]
MIRTLRFAAFSCLVLPACKKGDAIPAYIVIPAVTLSATPEEGGATSRITDVWVSVNDRSMGVWELPAKVPVLASGGNSLSITPAIKRNGSFDDRLRYPFYTTWNGTVELVPEQTIEVDPVVFYEEAANFWVESFDEAGSDFNVSEDSDTTLLLYTAAEHPEITLDGTSCSGFVLEPDRDRISIYTDQGFAGASGPSFVEMDYSTDIDLTLGVTYLEDGVSRATPWAVLVPTTGVGGLRWNKIYIEVSSFIGEGSISDRDLYITAALPGGQASAHVYLDNIKLVRRDP